MRSNVEPSPLADRGAKRPSHSAWLIVVAGLLFATGGAGVKACPSFSAWQIACTRSALAMVVILACVPSSRNLWSELRRSIRLWLVAIAYAATLTLYIAANKFTTAADAIFLQSTAPVFVLCASSLVLGERPTRGNLALVLAIAGGTTVLFLGASAQGTTAVAANTAPDVALGNWFGLASGACWAATLLGLRWLARATSHAPDRQRGQDAARAVVAGNVVTVLVAAPFALTESIETIPEPSEWAALAYLGVVQVGFAYVLMTRAMAALPAIRVSLLLMVEPAANPWIAWLVHGELPATTTWLGGAIIVGALVVHIVAPRSRRRP